MTELNLKLVSFSKLAVSSRFSRWMSFVGLSSPCFFARQNFPAVCLNLFSIFYYSPSVNSNSILANSRSGQNRQTALIDCCQLVNCSDCQNLGLNLPYCSLFQVQNLVEDKRDLKFHCVVELARIQTRYFLDFVQPIKQRIAVDF
jgi:hypothetical protein